MQGVATVRECPIGAGQGPTMFVAVRSDPPPFGALLYRLLDFSPVLGRVDGAYCLVRLSPCPGPGERLAYTGGWARASSSPGQPPLGEPSPTAVGRSRPVSRARGSPRTGMSGTAPPGSGPRA